MGIKKMSKKTEHNKKILIILSFVLTLSFFAQRIFASQVLEVGFVTEAAVNNGVFRVLIPTATDSANVSNATGIWTAGTAVAKAFVASSQTGTEITVTCPDNITGFTFGTPTKQIGTIFYDLKTNKEITQAQAASSGGNYVRYLGFLCPYTGVGAIGGQFATGGTANSITVSNLISPLANSGDINEAVIIPGKIQLLKNGYTAAQTSGNAENYLISDRDVMISAATRNVLITAKIYGQITFRINSIAANTSACGSTTTVASTPTTVNFGAPLVNTFVNAAQQLQVISSAELGYAVSVRQNSNMGRNGSTNCANDGLVSASVINRDCIPNFGWSETTPLAASAGLAWTLPTKTGFGYTVAKTSGDGTADVRFSSSKYSRFPTGAASDVGIASSTTVSNASTSDIYNVCYRLSLDAQNNAGVYANSVFYTITALF